MKEGKERNQRGCRDVAKKIERERTDDGDTIGQTNKRTDRQKTGGQTQTNRAMDRQVDRQRQTERQADRQSDRQTSRKAGTQAHKHASRQAGRRRHKTETKERESGKVIRRESCKQSKISCTTIHDFCNNLTFIAQFTKQTDI